VGFRVDVVTFFTSITTVETTFWEASEPKSFAETNLRCAEISRI